MIEVIIGSIISTAVILIVIYLIIDKKLQNIDKINESSIKLENTASIIEKLSFSLSSQINSIKTISTQLNLDFQKFYNTLIMKPSVRGSTGEGIVKFILNFFPEDLWQEQFKIQDSGTVDFAIFMPPDRRVLPLDSKFSLSEDLIPNIEISEGEIIFLNKQQRDKINKKVIENAKIITKYINPAVGTTNFALMFIPDSVYLALKNETLNKISSLKIIPVNTSGLLSTLFLIERQYASIKISKVVDHLEDIKSTIENNFATTIKILQTAQNQVKNANKNIKKAINSIENAEIDILTQFGLIEKES
ncbi:MAG: DNA recombination protein RmuC [Candidatus Helarchaeota archaeon]